MSPSVDGLGALSGLVWRIKPDQTQRAGGKASIQPTSFRTQRVQAVAPLLRFTLRGMECV